MLKRKMSLSIVAMTSAVLLFIGVSFAWLTLTDVIHLGDTEVVVNDIEATAVLQASEDGLSGWTDRKSVV